MVCCRLPMPMWKRLRRFSALPPEARSLLLRAAVLLPCVSLSLKLRGFRATQEWLRMHTDRKLTVADGGSSEVRTALSARMVNAACRHVWARASCLEKSLTLWQLLRSQGIETSLRIGARKSLGNFEAHAWLEQHGVPVNEADSPHKYAAFEPAIANVSELV